MTSSMSRAQPRTLAAGVKAAGSVVRRRARDLVDTIGALPGGRASTVALLSWWARRRRLPSLLIEHGHHVPGPISETIGYHLLLWRLRRSPERSLTPVFSKFRPRGPSADELWALLTLAGHEVAHRANFRRRDFDQSSGLPMERGV